MDSTQSLKIDLGVWPKQEFTLDSDATEQLYGGASEAGKSYLARVLAIKSCVGIPNLQCVLIRKKISDIIENHIDGSRGFRVLLKPLVDKKLCSITQDNIKFWNGAVITFKHCFTGDTQIQTTRGVKTIKELVGSSGTIKVTDSFTCEYRNVRLTRTSASLVLVVFDDGSFYRCTPDHRFLTDNGAIEARNLTGYSCITNESPLSLQQLKSLKGKDIHFGSSKSTTREVLADCTGLFGSTITDQSQRALKSTTKTRTETTTRLRTWKLWNAPLIEGYTRVLKSIKSKLERLLLKVSNVLGLGIAHLKDDSGTESKQSETNYTDSISNANGAERPIKDLEHTEHAPELAGANFTAQKRKCVSVIHLNQTEDVYCLTVPDIGLFPLSNGVLAFNCQDDRQFDSAQGIETQLLIVDEATQITERLIRMFRGWVRMPTEMQETLPEWAKGKYPRILYTANPVGVSLPFFRRHFVKARAHNSIELVDGFKRQYVPAKYTDNHSVDQEAHKGRMAGIGDKALARALDEGDWDAPTGEFFPEYDESRHVITDFSPPEHWFRYRSFDWGTAEPFAVGWFCVSDGEPFKDSDGHERWFPRGAIIMYKEWHGCDPESPSKGIRYRNEDIAMGILQRSEINHQKVATVTDSLPFQDRGGITIAKVFESNGVILTQGDTSRVTGWAQMRSLLIGKEFDSNWVDTSGAIVRVAMLYICESCKYARDYIPSLPRHPSETKKEDAADHGEATHICDMIRLACMVNKIVKDYKAPLESRIQKEIAANKPTIKGILKRQGQNYFS